MIINDQPLQILAEALAGVNVANCPHPCVTQPCGNRRCVPLMDYFACECGDGLSGEICEADGSKSGEDDVPRFDGDSFLHFSDSNTMRRYITCIRLFFKSVHSF